MVSQQLPFRFQEVKNLTELGFNPELFKRGNMTFESQKYIAIKEGAVSIQILFDLTRI
jgi:hypothetical protein